MQKSNGLNVEVLEPKLEPCKLSNNSGSIIENPEPKSRKGGQAFTVDLKSPKITLNSPQAPIAQPKPRGIAFTVGLDGEFD